MTKKICIEPFCKSKPTYKSLTDDVPKHCKKHRLNSEYNAKYKKCEVFTCLKMATWGNDNFERCGVHKLPTDDNRCNKNKKCQHKECMNIPSYGYEQYKPLVCASHKKNNMWGVTSKKCKVETCKTTASYGLEKNKPYFCYAHKTENEKYVLKKACCIEEGCKTIPTFGLPGKEAIYCKNHIPKDENAYVDLKHTVCEEKGCSKRPTFGLGWGKPKYCAEHKDNEHWDVANKRCEVAECNKYPSYGITNGIALRCVNHKLHSDIMVFFVSKKTRYNMVKNTDKYKTHVKLQYTKHKDKIIERNKIYYNDNYIVKLFQRAKQRVKTKKLEFDITLDSLLYLLQTQNASCIYCNCELQTTGNVGQRQPNVISIDRIDSAKGYTLDNVQLTCMFCNYAKNSWSDVEYRTFIECLKCGINDSYVEKDILFKDWRWKTLSCIRKYDKNSSLTLQWLDTQLEKQSWKCYYSGLNLIPKKGKPYIFQPSIERLDSSKAHTTDNCVLVCLPLNYGKCSTQLNDFLKHLNFIRNTP